MAFALKPQHTSLLEKTKMKRTQLVARVLVLMVAAATGGVTLSAGEIAAI